MAIAAVSSVARLDPEASESDIYADRLKLKVERVQIPPLKFDEADDLLPDQNGVSRVTLRRQRCEMQL